MDFILLEEYTVQILMRVKCAAPCGRDTRQIPKEWRYSGRAGCRDLVPPLKQPSSFAMAMVTPAHSSSRVSKLLSLCL